MSNINRQYIGARYVPKFIGTYVNTRAYEALDVVDDGYGTSYIARKPVPPNTPLTNTDYWFVYGASSGAILDLQNRMSGAERNIDKIEHKNAILIGDSWGSGLYATHGWIYNLKNMYPFETVYSDSYGGSGFVATGTGSSLHTFLYLLQNLAGSITDKNSIDTILVGGGVNDVGLTGVTTAIRTFVDYVDTTFPNAKVYIAVCNRNITGSSQISRYSIVNDYMLANGYKKKTVVVDLSKCASIENFVNTLHCNDAGYLQVAQALNNLLNGADYKNGYHTLTRTFTNSATNKQITLTFQELDDELNVSISSPGSMGSMTLTGNVWHTITFEPDTAVANAPYPYPNSYLPINLRLETTSGNYTAMQGVIEINANGVSISWIRVSTTAYTYTDIFIPSIITNAGKCW